MSGAGLSRVACQTATAAMPGVMNGVHTHSIARDERCSTDGHALTRLTLESGFTYTTAVAAVPLVSFEVNAPTAAVVQTLLAGQYTDAIAADFPRIAQAPTGTTVPPVSVQIDTLAPTQGKGSGTTDHALSPRTERARFTQSAKVAAVFAIGLQINASTIGVGKTFRTLHAANTPTCSIGNAHLS